MHQFRPQAQRTHLEDTQWYLEDGGVAVAERREWAVRRALQLLAFMQRLGNRSDPDQVGAGVGQTMHQRRRQAYIAEAHHRLKMVHWHSQAGFAFDFDAKRVVVKAQIALGQRDVKVLSSCMGLAQPDLLSFGVNPVSVR